MNNYDYPEGADTSDAPWNEVSVPPITFDVVICQALSRAVKVTTDDYTEGDVSEDVDYDDQGCSVASVSQGSPDTSDTDWKTAYSAEHMTILELLNELKIIKQIQVDYLETLAKSVANSEISGVIKAQLKRAKHIIAECEGWTEDDYEIVEY